MSAPQTFDDVLDVALDALRDGESLNAVIASHPQHAAELRRLLETSLDLEPELEYLPPTARLQSNFFVVEQALASIRGPRLVPQQAQPWWKRRVAFASLSLPAGVLAFALLGAGGAAAATLATTTDLSDRMARAAEHVAPEWTHALLPGGDESGEHAAGVHEHSPVATSATGGTPTPPSASTSAPSAATADARGPQPLVVAGEITNVRGNTFDLTAGGVVYKVQIDANTTVEGVIEEGATASVDAEVTGNDRLHATNVTITAAPAASDPPPEHRPGSPPVKTHTPSGHAEEQESKTPPGQAAKTKTPTGQAGNAPGPAATQPGPGGGSGGGNP